MFQIFITFQAKYILVYNTRKMQLRLLKAGDTLANLSIFLCSGYSVLMSLFHGMVLIMMVMTIIVMVMKYFIVC